MLFEIQDQTIRDGMQQRGIKKHFKAKCEVIDLISTISDITSVEIGMCTTQEDLNILKELITHLNKHQDYVILTRLRKKDIQLTSNLFSNHLIIKLLVPISRLHIEQKLGLTIGQLVRKVDECIKMVLDKKIKLEICFEDATRAEEKDLFLLLDLCNQHSIHYVTICDTVGCMTPDEYGALITKIKKQGYQYPISVHCHNDMGLATANTLSGVLAGANRIETTFLGIGERSGNTAIDEICYILQKKHYSEPINITKLYQVSQAIQTVLGFNSSVLKPIIGENAFVHESGIHQDGIQKQKEMYQYVAPEEFGLQMQTSISGISSKKIIELKIFEYLETQEIQLNEVILDQIIALYRSLTKIFSSITVEEVCDLYYLTSKKEKVYDCSKKCYATL